MKTWLILLLLADHGGKFDFIGWAGLSKNDPGAFYTSDAVSIFTDLVIVIALNAFSIGHLVIQAIYQRSTHPRQFLHRSKLALSLVTKVIGLNYSSLFL